MHELQAMGQLHRSPTLDNLESLVANGLVFGGVVIRKRLSGDFIGVRDDVIGEAAMFERNRGEL